MVLGALNNAEWELGCNDIERGELWCRIGVNRYGGEEEELQCSLQCSPVQEGFSSVT